VKSFKQMAEDIVEKVEAEASTSCVATTSTVNDKSSSTTSLKTDSSTAKNDDSDCGEDESEDEKEAKKKKKKKHKHKKKKEKTESDSDQEEWQEKTKDNLQKFEKARKSLSDDDDKKMSRSSSKSPERTKSSCNPNAPVKRWDSKPELGAIGRSVTWDGSKGADIVAELNKGSGIRSWSGDRSDLERKRDERKRGAETDNDDIDRGKVKKVKKRKEEAAAYNKSSNPFQTAQNAQNKSVNKNERDGSSDRRSFGSNFQRSDFRYNSGSKGNDNRFYDQNNRNYGEDNRNFGGDNRNYGGDFRNYGGDNRNFGGNDRNYGGDNRFNNRNFYGSGNSGHSWGKAGNNQRGHFSPGNNAKFSRNY